MILAQDTIRIIINDFTNTNLCSYQIANKNKICQRTVESILKKHLGSPIFEKKEELALNMICTEIQKLQDEGLSKNEIANQLGISRSTCYRIILNLVSSHNEEQSNNSDDEKVQIISFNPQQEDKESADSVKAVKSAKAPALPANDKKAKASAKPAEHQAVSAATKVATSTAVTKASPSTAVAEATVPAVAREHDAGSLPQKSEDCSASSTVKSQDVSVSAVYKPQPLPYKKNQRHYNGSRNRNSSYGYNNHRRNARPYHKPKQDYSQTSTISPPVRPLQLLKPDRTAPPLKPDQPAPRITISIDGVEISVRKMQDNTEQIINRVIKALREV